MHTYIINYIHIYIYIIEICFHGDVPHFYLVSTAKLSPARIDHPRAGMADYHSRYTLW